MGDISTFLWLSIVFSRALPTFLIFILLHERLLDMPAIECLTLKSGQFLELFCRNEAKAAGWRNVLYSKVNSLTISEFVSNLESFQKRKQSHGG